MRKNLSYCAQTESTPPQSQQTAMRQDLLMREETEDQFNCKNLLIQVDSSMKPFQAPANLSNKSVSTPDLSLHKYQRAI
jgi:hypothetical protein